MQVHLDHFQSQSRKIEAERVAWNAQVAALSDKINDAAAELAHAERISNGDNEVTAPLRAKLRMLKQERAQLKAPSFIDPLEDVESYARSHPNAAAAEPIRLKVPNGQTPLAVHNNFAEKTNTVLAEIARVSAAPSAVEDIGAGLVAQIDAVARSGAPRLVNGKLQFARQVVDSNGVVITLENAIGLVAFLCRDALVGAAQKLVRSGGPGLTAQVRRSTLTDLEEKFASALRLEAAAAAAAEQAGQRVIRRRHVHPAILLNLKVDPAAVYDWFAKKKGA